MVICRLLEIRLRVYTAYFSLLDYFLGHLNLFSLSLLKVSDLVSEVDLGCFYLLQERLFEIRHVFLDILVLFLLEGIAVFITP